VPVLLSYCINQPLWKAQVGTRPVAVPRAGQLGNLLGQNFSALEMMEPRAARHGQALSSMRPMTYSSAVLVREWEISPPEGGPLAHRLWGWFFYHRMGNTCGLSPGISCTRELCFQGLDTLSRNIGAPKSGVVLVTSYLASASFSQICERFTLSGHLK